MIPITFNSATAYLIDDAPDWVSPPQLSAQAPASGEKGLTGREARTPLAEKLRLGLSYSAILEDSEQLTNFRNALQDLADKVVLCPLWVYPIEAGATPDVTADFYALLGDGADPEIGEAADLPFDRPAFPLLVGKFRNIPDPIPFDDEKAAVTIDFEESEEWAITLPEFEFGLGVSESVLDIHSPKLWLKANSLSQSDNTTVSTWPDSSGQGNDVTVGGGAPKFRTGILNSLPIIRFSGSDYFDVGSFIGSFSAGEIAVVLKASHDPDPDGASNWLWYLGSSADGTAYPDTSGSIKEQFGTNARKTTVNPTPALTSWRLYDVSSAANSFKTRLDNAEIYSTATNTVGFTSSGAAIGTNVGRFGGFIGDIAEVIIWDRVLTNDERADVVQYLSDKYALGLVAPDTGSGSDVFPFRPNWAQRPKSGNAEVYVERQKIGQRRQDAKAYYDQRSRRHVEQGFTLTDLEPWQLLRLFQDFHGTAGTFWLPTGISDARLTADVDAADTALTVDNPTGRGENTVVVLDDLTNRVRLEITDTDGNDWNLTGAVGTDFVATGTRVESAAYARFRYRYPDVDL
jgi:hypothetical protein